MFVLNPSPTKLYCLDEVVVDVIKNCFIYNSETEPLCQCSACQGFFFFCSQFLRNLIIFHRSLGDLSWHLKIKLYHHINHCLCFLHFPGFPGQPGSPGPHGPQGHKGKDLLTQ